MKSHLQFELVFWPFRRQETLNVSERMKEISKLMISCGTINEMRSQERTGQSRKQLKSNKERMWKTIEKKQVISK